MNPRPPSAHRPRWRGAVFGSCALGLLWGFGPFRAEALGGESALTAEQIHDLFSQAKEKFREANRLAKPDPKAAAALYEESVTRYRKLIEQGGIQNGKLYYNIANAYMLKGDLGRAILNYRRAEELMPADHNLQSNLQFARSKVRDQIPPKPRQRILETVFFWHYDLPAGLRLVLFAAAFNLIWLLALLKLLNVIRARVRVPVSVLALAAALLLGSLIVEEVARQGLREGVIVASEAVGRKGPDAANYEPSFKEPLHVGVECEIVEERSHWYLVLLNDGRETWLPASAVEPI